MSEPLFSDQLLKRVDRAELNSLDQILGFIPSTDPLKPEDLDRATAEKKDWEQMQYILAAFTDDKEADRQPESVMAVAAASRQIHEASRARRDINIATASHKKLMLGCYQTLYQRKLKLEKKIRQEEA